MYRNEEVQINHYVYDKDFIFVLIGKNAHTSMERIFVHELGWTFGRRLQSHRELVTKDTKYLGIIRHPIDRWISGITQYYVSKPRKEFTLEIIKEMLTVATVKRCWLDTHSSPQSYVYDKCRPLKLFRMEDLDKLWDYLEHEGYGSFNTNFYLNKHTEDKAKKQFYDYLKKELDNNPQYIAKLLTIFKDDLVYYNSVKS